MRTTIAVVLGCVLSGCAQTKTEPAAPYPIEAAPPGQTAAAAISYNPDELDSLVESLEVRARALPGGGTVAAHRDAMHGFFGAVADVLPALEGPEQSGAFLQQLRTIESARDRLAPDVGTATIDAPINTGLRATSVALNRIGTDEDVSGQALTDMLGRLDAKVDELEQVRVEGRPFIAADAGVLIAQAARQMADRLAGRVTDTPAIATEPAAPPTAEVPPAPEAAPPASTDSAAEAPAAEKPAEEKPADTETKVIDVPSDKSIPKFDAAPNFDEKPAEEAPAEPAPAELNK
jgi:hypothetical protein